MKANWVLILIVMAIAALIGGGAWVMSRERKPAPEISGGPVEKPAPVPAPAPKVIEPPAAAVTEPPSPASAKPAHRTAIDKKLVSLVMVVSFSARPSRLQWPKGWGR